MAKQTLVEVRVRPRAGRDSVELLSGPKLRVRVAAAPEGGKANEAVVALIARKLRVARSAITIVRGHRSRDKIVRLDGLGPDELVARLSGA